MPPLAIDLLAKGILPSPLGPVPCLLPPQPVLASQTPRHAAPVQARPSTPGAASLATMPSPCTASPTVVAFSAPLVS